MSAQDLAYSLDSHFLAPLNFHEILPLYCQFSHALEKMVFVCLLLFCFIHNFVCSVLREFLQASCQKYRS